MKWVIEWKNKGIAKQMEKQPIIVGELRRMQQRLKEKHNINIRVWDK